MEKPTVAGMTVTKRLRQLLQGKQLNVSDSAIVNPPSDGWHSMWSFRIAVFSSSCRITCDHFEALYCPHGVASLECCTAQRFAKGEGATVNITLV
jgi:hypothetical protein